MRSCSFAGTTLSIPELLRKRLPRGIFVCKQQTLARLRRGTFFLKTTWIFPTKAAPFCLSGKHPHGIDSRDSKSAQKRRKRACEMQNVLWEGIEMQTVLWVRKSFGFSNYRDKALQNKTLEEGASIWRMLTCNIERRRPLISVNTS